MFDKINAFGIALRANLNVFLNFLYCRYISPKSANVPMSIHLFKSTITGRGGKHPPLYDRSHLAGLTKYLKSDCLAAGVVSVSQSTILWVFSPS
jgi:hypothetical protein